MVDGIVSDEERERFHDAVRECDDFNVGMAMVEFDEFIEDFVQVRLRSPALDRQRDRLVFALTRTPSTNLNADKQGKHLPAARLLSMFQPNDSRDCDEHRPPCTVVVLRTLRGWASGCSC